MPDSSPVRPICCIAQGYCNTWCTQGIMVDYFKGRDAPLARSGLSALQKTMAGLYYLPYLCGAMLHFRFSGQSIPNRYAHSSFACVRLV